MATYPELPLSVQSNRTPVDFGARDFTADGAAHARDFADHNAYRFSLVHEHITKSQADSVYAVWQADPLATVDLTWKNDGQIYTCIWDGPPIVDHENGPHWFCRSKLITYVPPIPSAPDPCDPSILVDVEPPIDTTIIGPGVAFGVQVENANEDRYDLLVQDPPVCINGTAHVGIDWLCVGDQITSYDHLIGGTVHRAELIIIRVQGACNDRGTPGRWT